MGVRTSFEGWFEVELIDAASGRVKQRHRFRNLLTNNFLDLVGSSTTNLVAQQYNNTGLIRYLQLGTGSTAPTNADTALATPIAVFSNITTTAQTYGYVAGPPDYWWYKIWREFSEAQANGNLSELGFWTADTAGTLVNRQLIKDSGGTPITITKTSADKLRISYEFRVYPPAADVSGTVTLATIDYDYTIRANDVDDDSFAQGGWIGPIQNARWGNSVSNSFKYGTTQTLAARTANMSLGTSGNPTSMTYASYSGGTYYRDLEVRADPADSNLTGGIGCFKLSWTGLNNFHAWQGVFSTKIPKDNTKRLIINLRWAWDRL